MAIVTYQQVIEGPLRPYDMSKFGIKTACPRKDKITYTGQIELWKDFVPHIKGLYETRLPELNDVTEHVELAPGCIPVGNEASANASYFVTTLAPLNLIMRQIGLKRLFGDANTAQFTGAGKELPDFTLSGHAGEVYIFGEGKIVTSGIQFYVAIYESPTRRDKALPMFTTNCEWGARTGDEALTMHDSDKGWRSGKIYPP